MMVFSWPLASTGHRKLEGVRHKNNWENKDTIRRCTQPLTSEKKRQFSQKHTSGGCKGKYRRVPSKGCGTGSAFRKKETAKIVVTQPC